jgi:hypothetical protein
MQSSKKAAISTAVLAEAAVDSRARKDCPQNNILEFFKNVT